MHAAAQAARCLTSDTKLAAMRGVLTPFCLGIAPLSIKSDNSMRRIPISSCTKSKTARGCGFAMTHSAKPATGTRRVKEKRLTRIHQGGEYSQCIPLLGVVFVLGLEDKLSFLCAIGENAGFL